MSDDLILPTDGQVERAARMMCAADGHDPDSNTQEIPGYDPLDAGHYVSIAQFSEPNWKQYKQSARKHLILFLNKDRILGESEARLDLWSKCDDAGMAHAIANIRATELDCADWGEDLLREIVNAVIAGLNGQCYVSKRKD